MEPLSPEAEAFRAELSAGGQDRPAEFGAWQRSRRRRLVLAWALRIAFLAPGILSLMVKASWPLAAGLELAGFAAGWWLQRERGRHRAEVLAWTPEPWTQEPE